MTVTITIRNQGLSPGELTAAYTKYLEMRREIGYDRVRWEEDEE